MSDSNSKKILNLDELYGKSEPIIVVWRGEEYELRRPEAMGPEEWMRYGRLADKMRDIQSREDATSEEIADALRETMELLSPDLAAAGLPYGMMLAVMNHYREQITSGNDEKKAPSVPTGA